MDHPLEKKKKVTSVQPRCMPVHHLKAIQNLFFKGKEKKKVYSNLFHCRAATQCQPLTRDVSPDPCMQHATYRNVMKLLLQGDTAAQNWSLYICNSSSTAKELAFLFEGYKTGIES